jgi:hypothetical protein
MEELALLHSKEWGSSSEILQNLTYTTVVLRSMQPVFEWDRPNTAGRRTLVQVRKECSYTKNTDEGA